MPFNNVTIEASWEKIGAAVSVEDNPDTAVATLAIYCVLFGVLSAVIGLIRYAISCQMKQS